MEATDPTRAAPPRVYLTGPMGAGKSTVGRVLARRLGWAFLDLDAAIAEAAGHSVPELFRDEGEAAFRAREAAALRATACQEGVVVATGGGALVQPGAMAWARAHGRVFYLSARAEVLAGRLLAATNRPLLAPEGQPLDGTVLRERIGALLTARESAYRQAHHTVDAEAAPEDVAEEIVHALGARG